MPENAFNADGKTGQNGINVVRNKTFNPEFRQLVNRVMGKEIDPGNNLSDINEIDDLSEEELLRRLYRLYYMNKSVIDNQEINVSFKPFDVTRGIIKAGASDALAGYIKNQIQKISYNAFAVLAYSVPLKGYIPIIHNLEHYAVENIVISIKSKLFNTIFSSSEGIIIDSGSIHDDFFLDKLFQVRDGKSWPLYFVMLSSLTSELERELAIPGRKIVSPFLPSAICMVEIRESDTPKEPRQITNILKRRLSVPLFLINNDLSQDLSLKSFKGLSNSFHLLDYFFTVFLIKKDNVGINIKLSRQSDSTTAFLMKYIISKLNYILPSDSAIIHILRNQLLILTKSVYIDPITNIVDSHNNLFDEKLKIYKFYPKDYDDSIKIIQEFILNN